MNRVIETRRVFVAGQLVEYWESPDQPFGCGHEELQTYVDRHAWVLLFNALTLIAAGPAVPLGS